MIPIQISHYKFSLREPFAAGQTITAAEAEVLNGVRISRLRNIIYRLLQKRSNEKIMSVDEFEKFSAEVQKLDLEFKFEPAKAKPHSAWTLQDELEIVARERAEELIRQEGLDPGVEDLTETITAVRQLGETKDEAQRRFVLRQKAAAEALSELL